MQSRASVLRAIRKLCPRVDATRKLRPSLPVSPYDKCSGIERPRDRDIACCLSIIMHIFFLVTVVSYLSWNAVSLKTMPLYLFSSGKDSVSIKISLYGDFYSNTRTIRFRPKRNTRKTLFNVLEIIGRCLWNLVKKVESLSYLSRIDSWHQGERIFPRDFDLRSFTRFTIERCLAIALSSTRNQSNLTIVSIYATSY